MDLSELCLYAIPDKQHDQARRAIEAGEARGFLGLADSPNRMNLVLANTNILQERGIYEEALLYALISPSDSHYQASMGLLRQMIRVANKEKLRAAGDLLPGLGPFTLFRGVAGKRYRRVRGISWTGNFDKAVWFAKRFGREDPAVYKAVVEAEYVLARATERKEDEYIVLLPKSVKVTRTDWRYQQRESA